ncbi:ATP-binding cassette domain-containing protein [Pelagibacterales bacterium SAG-MED15]|nr:ATP-binding cassette domain-containing protein [Pelagibacterales bacterium SAG-MED15]
MAIIKKFRIKSFKKNEPLLELKNISKSFGDRKILDNVSIKVNRGEILGLLGPNGAGKSTIFNLITGLLKPEFGKILFGNSDATNFPIYMRTRKFNIGYVPQYGGYFSDLTTYDNLKAIAQILINDPREQNSKIEYLISKFELDYVRNIKSSYLSGGQKKKLVIAIALLGDPKILLLDECFAALDVLTIQMLQKIIVNLQTEERIGIIICDHQARDLLSCVDIAMILSNCKIIAQGTPKELINNSKARNAYFGDAFKIN